jgi:EAL domain-containing protein (putative c-di-GMP-specific phosphodiesterase class I)
VESVAGMLAEVGLDPRELVLELTETILMKNIESAIATLQSMNQLGVGIALDDFGTGYSSLNYLKRFPITTLKIDGSFVRNITTDIRDKTITTALVDLAHGLGLNVVAEAVETQEQLELLRSIGCDRIQGYLFSRPLPAMEAERMLELPPAAEE